MESIIWHYIIPIILFTVYFIGFFSLFKGFKEKLGLIIKNSNLRNFVVTFCKVFTFLSIVLYLVTLNEGFENKNLGQLSVFNYFKNFYNTIEYYFGWILFYWMFYIFLGSLLSSLIWTFSRKLVK